MTKDELKKDFYFELRDRFRHTTDPYQDVTGWALTDFIAEYLANKLAICSVSNRTLEDLKPIGYKCLRCGREFEEKIPHKCDTGYRKRNMRWRPKYEQYGC